MSSSTSDLTRGLRPPGVAAIWPVLGFLVFAYAAHDLLEFGGGGMDDFFDRWVNNVILWGAAAACLAGALRGAHSRVAWIFAAAAIASWAIGDTIFAIRFDDAADAPLTTISDAFWLAWLPLITIALALLVRDRVPKFELHRWIDGIVVMLLVATPWVALFLQPVAEESTAGALDEVVEFAYPLGEAILVGAVVGVFALMGWRPGRMWLMLGVGLTIMGLADAIYSVQALGETYQEADFFNSAWAGGAVLVAYASWQPHPGRLDPIEITGWRAIALPLAAQAMAIAVQIYALFHELPQSERVLTIVVLLIATVQIIVSRPPTEPDVRAAAESDD